MSNEDRSRMHRELYRGVVSNTGAYWSESFITEALRVASDGTSHPIFSLKVYTIVQRRFSLPIPHLSVQSILDRFQNAQQRVLILSYDGTLVPYEKRIDAVSSTSRRLDRILTLLTQDERNQVFVVSSRTRRQLDARFTAYPTIGIA